MLLTLGSVSTQGHSFNVDDLIQKPATAAEAGRSWIAPEASLQTRTSTEKTQTIGSSAAQTAASSSHPVISATTPTTTTLSMASGTPPASSEGTLKLQQTQHITTFKYPIYT